MSRRRVLIAKDFIHARVTAELYWNWQSLALPTRWVDHEQEPVDYIDDVAELNQMAIGSIIYLGAHWEENAQWGRVEFFEWALSNRWVLTMPAPHKLIDPATLVGTIVRPDDV